MPASQHSRNLVFGGTVVFTLLRAQQPGLTARVLHSGFLRRRGPRHQAPPRQPAAEATGEGGGPRRGRVVGRDPRGQ